MEIDSNSQFSNNNNNNNINNTDNIINLDEIDDISNILNKTTTSNKKFNKKNINYQKYSRIVEEEKCNWFYVIFNDNSEDVIQSDSKIELLNNYKNIKKIKFSKMEPTWYKLEEKYTMNIINLFGNPMILLKIIYHIIYILGIRLKTQFKN